jgi:hypothetical protein
VERKLREYVDKVDNLSDREDQKLERVEIRFSRVREFLDYLQSEEGREQKEFDLAKRAEIWSEPFVPKIRSQVEQEIGWIERRLKENREKYAQDIKFESDLDETVIMDIAAVADEDGDDEEAKSASSS